MCACSSIGSLFDDLKLPFGSVGDAVPENENQILITSYRDAESVLRDINRYKNLTKFSAGKSTKGDETRETSALSNVPPEFAAKALDPVRLNQALRYYANENWIFKVDRIIKVMGMNNVAVDDESIVAVIRLKTKRKLFDEAEALFDRLTSTSSPSIHAWEAIVSCKCERGKPDEALQMIDGVLNRSGISPTVDMLNSVLKCYVNQGRLKEDCINDLWRRMHVENFSLNLDSFHIMLRYCSKSFQAERAFFYLDELKSIKLQPTIETYVRLIRATAEAPHWVPGFNDIIFDAMSMLEGSELVPTVEVYNAIIHAFGKAGDATASEFYYWEMVRKGIAGDTATFNALLFAYARNCSVYAKCYGYKGRYAKPLDRKYRNDAQAIADVGPMRMSEHCECSCAGSLASLSAYLNLNF